MFDFGNGETTTVSQPAANQVIIAGTGDYEVNDAVEFSDNTNQPTGTYGQSQITQVSQTGGNTLLTLNQNVSIHNLGKDYCCDLTQAGPITATNCTFNCANGRHVYFRSGVSTTVTGCTFLDATPLILGGWDGGEVPSDVHNVAITGCTFQNSLGILVTANGGNDTAPCGSNVTISGNKFIDGGRYGQQNAEPVTVKSVTGVVIKNNWFERNFGANITALNDANVQISGNVFSHPNEVHPSSAGPNDFSLMYLRDVNGVSVSGNLLSGAGPFTRTLQNVDATVTNATGLVNGTLQIDSPLVFLLNNNQGAGH